MKTGTKTLGTYLSLYDAYAWEDEDERELFWHLINECTEHGQCRNCPWDATCDQIAEETNTEEIDYELVTKLIYECGYTQGNDCTRCIYRRMCSQIWNDIWDGGYEPTETDKQEPRAHSELS